ncbi:MAG: helix-turn-helix transcriptional regulator [Myxococcales bacterium]|nr:helix-turn-helix transcriptional regulator [Myxococcales bacterium]MCB9719115.1 helix-turn-helix transcriptional regulator [Myxococcales bacterium]
MDPERNPAGKASQSGDDTAVAAVPVEATASAAPSGDAAASTIAEPSASANSAKKKSRTRPKAGTHPNNVRKLRQGAMMSKAELARRAGVSPLTIDRVEAGCPCRMDTKRKILEALGLQPSAAKQVFPDLETP